MKIPESVKDHKLCYVRDGKLWFADCEPEEVWGDDWNDAPYEHNAGDPYKTRTKKDGSKVYVSYATMIIEGHHFDEPHEDHFNSPFSVEMINAKHTPWLNPDKWVETITSPPVFIFAGESMQDVFKKLIDAGEVVYLPYTMFDEQGE